MGVTREGAWLEESGGFDQGGGVARGEWWV